MASQMVHLVYDICVVANVTLALLSHIFASRLAMKGESLYKIATLMGNSPEICRRHYAALMPESLVTTVEFSGLPRADHNDPRKQA
jgi:hypothetical protein